MTIWNWIIVIVVFAILAAAAQILHAKAKRDGMNTHLESLKGFNASQKFMGENGETGLAIDENQKTICLIENTISGINTRIFGYSDILSSEIFEDGITINKTQRSSQLGGAIIGGLLLGGVGALVGGLTGSTKSTGKVRRMDLRIIVNDTAKPMHDVNFMMVESAVGGIVHSHASQQARYWHGLIEVLIKRADMEDKAKAIEAPSSTHSLADELKKLADLRQAGILSDDEFQTQKTRLLG